MHMPEYKVPPLETKKRNIFFRILGHLFLYCISVFIVTYIVKITVFIVRFTWTFPPHI